MNRLFFHHLTFSNRRVGDTGRRSSDSRGRKGDGKRWTRGRRGERENKRPHGINYWVNYLYASKSISTEKYPETLTCVSASVRLQPTTLSGEDVMLLPQEEPGLSVERPGPPTDQLTPVSVPMPVPVLPSPPSAAEEPGGATLESEVRALLKDRTWWRFLHKGAATLFSVE